MSEVSLYIRALMGYGDGTLMLFASLTHSPSTLSLTLSIPSLTHSLTLSLRHGAAGVRGWDAAPLRLFHILPLPSLTH